MSKIFSGLKAWYWQRISATFLLFAFLYLTISVYCLELNTFSSWTQWANGWFNSLTIILTAIAINYHAWVGFRDIVLDYTKSQGLKIFILTIFAIGFIILPLSILIILF